MLKTRIRNLTNNQVGPVAETQSSPDTVYLNVKIPYSPSLNGDSPAVYQAQFTQPLLYNPQDYYCAVVNFQVSGINIPIMIARIQPAPNTNPNNTVYSVAIGYNGVFSAETFVQYVPTDSSIPVPPVPTSPGGYTPYYYVYVYTDFINMINTALATAFASIATPVASEAPYLIYDPDTLRISLIAQEAFYNLDGSVALPITIYMNYALYQYMDGMPIINLGTNAANRNIRFNVQNFNDTNWYAPSGPSAPPPTLELLEMQQEYNTLADWNSLQSIQLISNLLPINREFVPAAGSLNTGGVVTAQGVLADFTVLVNNGPEFRSTIEYVANGPWRLIDMYGPAPITRADLYFYWVDELGEARILQNPVGKSASAKILFIKKSVVGQLADKM